jgi:hypothetical protein
LVASHEEKKGLMVEISHLKDQNYCLGPKIEKPKGEKEISKEEN